MKALLPICGNAAKRGNRTPGAELLAALQPLRLKPGEKPGERCARESPGRASAPALTRGLRDSCRARASLARALARENLQLLRNAAVDKIEIDGRRATGVRLNGGELISAKREVLLCAGAIKTPQLPLLSGLGGQDQLAATAVEALAEGPLRRLTERGLGATADGDHG